MLAMILSWSLLRCPHATVRWRHRRARSAVRGEHAVRARQVHARWRHQRRQACHEIQRFKHDVRGAVAVWVLQRVAHVAGCRQRQTLAGHGRMAHVAAEALEPLALVRRDGHTGVQ